MTKVPQVVAYACRTFIIDEGFEVGNNFDIV